MHFLDLPVWNVEATAEAGYVAALQKPWPGSVAVYRSPGVTGFQLKALATAPATVGTTLDTLLAGPEARFDRRARVRVRLTQGQLTSCDALALFGGANMAAIRNGAGAWEIIQFQNAVLTDVLTYELSGLLRGQFGTEGARATVAAGAPFVLLDGAIAQVPLGLEDVKLPFNWRVGPGNRDIGDASYVTTAHTFSGNGLRPLSPVHVRGVRASGDLTIAWKRRTRVGGDSWEASDVPLGEEAERYEVDILDGAMVKRTVSVSSPSAVYTAAQQTSDFGSAQASVSLKVYQTNASFGRGAGRAAIV